MFRGGSDGRTGGTAARVSVCSEVAAVRRKALPIVSPMVVAPGTCAPASASRLSSALRRRYVDAVVAVAAAVAAAMWAVSGTGECLVASRICEF